MRGWVHRNRRALIFGAMVLLGAALASGIAFGVLSSREIWGVVALLVLLGLSLVIGDWFFNLWSDLATLSRGTRSLVAIIAALAAGSLALWKWLIN